MSRRVWIVADDLGGGTGNHVVAMWRRWDPARWTLAVTCMAPLGARTRGTVPVTVLPPWRWYDVYPVGHLRRLFILARQARRAKPDLVHAYFFWSILWARLLKRLGLVRLLVENREDEGFSWGWLERALLRLTARQPDLIICVSQAVRRVVLRREHVDPGRVVVIPNGVSLPGSSAADRSPIRHSLGLPTTAPVVGMVANLNRPVKAVHIFLEAMAGILDAVPRARFLIVGGGRDEEALRRRAQTLGIADAVCFAGYRDDVAPFYGAMDVSVLTSLSEGLSITLLESMAAGLPVVVTRVGGNPEVVVEGETGYLVPPRDVRAFTDRVVELLRDPALRARMGAAGRARVATQFRIDQVAERYTAEYARLLGEPDAPAAWPKAASSRASSFAQ
jgi:glycosyltransferase involved in cell wall biosynthesis